VRRSQIDETISGLAVGHCGYAQPPASVVPALRAPPSRTPFYFVTGSGHHHGRCSWQSTSNLLSMVSSSAAGWSLRVLLGLVLLSAAWAAEAPGEGSDVMVLTVDNFDQAVKDHSFLVVEFFAPW
jgi:hypothetical protein